MNRTFRSSLRLLSAACARATGGNAAFIATFERLWARLKAHKVVQWTLAYLAIAYTLLHGAEMLAGTLNWSHGLLRIFTLILILGVPVIITLPGTTARAGSSG